MTTPALEAPWAVSGLEAESPPAAGPTLQARIVSIALRELARWGDGSRSETDTAMASALRDYWTGLGLSTSDANQRIANRTAWSAAFVSWVMREAGAGAAFGYSAAHRVYVGAGKAARSAGDQSRFQSFRVSEATPEPGDVIVADRFNDAGACAGTTFDNVDNGTEWPTHGDIVVSRSGVTIEVVGGNVSDSVKRKTLTLDAAGRLPATSGSCALFAIVKLPGGNAAGPGVPAPAGGLASLPARIAELIRTGAATAEFGVALLGGVRDENRLTNLLFFARHPEMNGRRIERHETELAREWLRLRDTIVRPAIAAMAAGGPAPVPTGGASRPPGPVPPGETVEAFATRLGSEWSAARATASLSRVSPEEMKRWLIQDHRDTVEGAKRRWEKPGRPAPDITGAWMIGRTEQMKFQTAPSSKLPGLAGFAAPAPGATLVSSPQISGSDVAPVAPSTVRFVSELKSRYPSVRVSTYRGHGGGPWKDRGYSLDLFLGAKDARGFYEPAAVIEFLRVMHLAAQATGHQWRAIYDDFTVADAVNRAHGRHHVIFVGSARKEGNRVLGLNWHGPDPLILHLHVDIAPR